MENIKYIIDNLLKQPKSNKLFFFKECTLDDVAKTVTALSNANGGDVLIGVGNNKSVCGIKNDTFINLSDFLAGNIHPTPAFNIYNVPYEGKNVLLISVWQGALPPYSFNDSFYCLKNGEISVNKANKFDIETLFDSRMAMDNNWERQLSPATIEDLNLSLVKKTMSLMASQSDRSDDPLEFLMSKGLVRQGFATNGCVILFATNPSQFIPQSMVRLLIYDERNELKQSHSYSKCLLDLIPSLFEQLDKFYWNEIVIDSLKRKEKCSYPIIAIREAVLNSLIHKMYDSPSSFVNISLYANRIEITNSGSLPDGIKQSDLKKNHLSILRNPDIAYICFLNQYIEMAGSGTLRILKDCKDNGFIEPKWICTKNTVTIIFPGIMMRQPSQSKLSFADTYLTNMSDEKKNDLLRIVDFIKANPNSKTDDIEKLIGKSTATVKRYIKELQNFAIITYVGGKKYGGYVVVDTPD